MSSSPLPATHPGPPPEASAAVLVGLGRSWRRLERRLLEIAAEADAILPRAGDYARGTAAGIAMSAEAFEAIALAAYPPAPRGRLRAGLRGAWAFARAVVVVGAVLAGSFLLISLFLTGLVR